MKPAYERMVNLFFEEFGQPESKYGTPKKKKGGRRQFVGPEVRGGGGEHIKTAQDIHKAKERKHRLGWRDMMDTSIKGLGLIHSRAAEHRRQRGKKKVKGAEKVADSTIYDRMAELMHESIPPERRMGGGSRYTADYREYLDQEFEKEDKARRSVPPLTQKQVEAKKRVLAALFRANLKAGKEEDKK